MIQQLKDDFEGNILSYWLKKMVDPSGGFYGRRDGADRLDPEAPKGAILNARILWTFSAAYRVTGKPEYEEAALRSRDYLLSHFVDEEQGGVFWSVTPQGEPLDTKKQFYAIAFAIYGLAEHFRATGDRRSLDMAVRLYHDIESHSRDHEKGGCTEAATRDWLPIADMRLSDKDENASKTMNTHLHILEAYAALLRVYPDEGLRNDLKSLVRIFLDRIVDHRNWHLGLFFDNSWRRLDGEISYGHDIEASWLLYEASELIGDPALHEEVKEATRHIAMAALEGRCCDGSLVYERHADGSYDNEKHWWPQAEAVVGMLYLWKYHDMPEMLGKARQTWEFIRDNLVDREAGEWYWSIFPDGTVNRRDDKAGFWKCPYHNSRMHIEALSILQA